MISVRMSFFIIFIAFVLVLIPSFAVISSSQSNNSLSNASISEESDDDTPFFENETSFASLSRSLAETNQSEDEEPIPPPSGSDDEADGEEAND